MAYSFAVTVASRGFHVYKNTSWTNVKIGEKVTVKMGTKKSSLEVDSYACAIKIKTRSFNSLITMIGTILDWFKIIMIKMMMKKRVTRMLTSL